MISLLHLAAETRCSLSCREGIYSKTLFQNQLRGNARLADVRPSGIPEVRGMRSLFARRVWTRVKVTLLKSGYGDIDLEREKGRVWYDRFGVSRSYSASKGCAELPASLDAEKGFIVTPFANELATRPIVLLVQAHVIGRR